MIEEKWHEWEAQRQERLKRIDFYHCYFCGKSCGFACADCLPDTDWGKIRRTREGDLLFNGKLKLIPLLFFKGEKIIRCHDQTSLMLVENVPGNLTFQIKYRLRRFKWWMFGWFADYFIAPNEDTFRNLQHFGLCSVILVRQDAHRNLVKINKRPHQGINILYYLPCFKRNGKYKKWAYGYDQFEKLRQTNFKQPVNYFIVDGTLDPVEFRNLLEITDILFNYRRFPNISRLEDECRLNGIPVAKSVEEVENIICSKENWIFKSPIPRRTGSGIPDPAR